METLIIVLYAGSFWPSCTVSMEIEPPRHVMIAAIGSALAGPDSMDC